MKSLEFLTSQLCFHHVMLIFIFVGFFKMCILETAKTFYCQLYVRWQRKSVRIKWNGIE